MTKIYVVRGSEDGNIAAFLSAAKAAKCALDYVCEGEYREGIAIYGSHSAPNCGNVTGLSAITKALRLGSDVNGIRKELDSWGATSSEIEIFIS